jgi:RNA polymerase sigma-70 factor (ECF subfamily)
MKAVNASLKKTSHRQDIARVKAILRGDEGLFKAFFEEFYERLFRFVLTQIDGDRHHAEDIVQQALMNAIRGMRHYRGEAPLQSWVFTVCRNAIVDFRRREGLRSRTVVHEHDVPQLWDVILHTESPTSSNPEVSAEIFDDVNSVRDTLTRLPPSHRSVLEWKYLDGWSAKEIALKLGISVEATSSLVARAKRSFAAEHARSDSETEQ